MAFNLSLNPTYKWPVKVVISSDEGVGRFQTMTFDATFNRLEQSRINEIVENGNKKARGEPLEPGEDLSDFELLSEIMSGWDDVKDKGEQVPYSAAALKKMCEIPTAAAQVAQTWLDSLQKAKAKN